MLPLSLLVRPRPFFSPEFSNSDVRHYLEKHKILFGVLRYDVQLSFKHNFLAVHILSWPNFS